MPKRLAYRLRRSSSYRESPCPDCSQTIDVLREFAAVVRDIDPSVLVNGTPQADRYHAASEAATARLKAWEDSGRFGSTQGNIISVEDIDRLPGRFKRGEADRA